MATRDLLIVLRSPTTPLPLSYMCIEVIIKTLTSNGDESSDSLMSDHNIEVMNYLCTQCAFPLHTRDMLVATLLKYQQFIPPTTLHRTVFKDLISNGIHSLDLISNGIHSLDLISNGIP